MFCEKCGKEVKEGKAFCTECGAPVKEKPEAAASQPSPPPPTAQPAPPAAAPGLPGVVAPPPPPRKKHTGLIVGIAVLAAVIVAVVLVLVLLVFSSNVGQAKKLINKAAPIMKGLESKGTKLGTDLNTLLTDTSSYKTSADYEAAADKIRAQVDAINKEEDQAATYISQVQKLGGVPDYKEFAAVVADLIRTDKKLMLQVTDYLTYLGDQFKAIDAGQTVDNNVVAARTSDFIAKVKELAAQSEDLKTKAEKIRTEKNL
jgi:hypothetical protein